jgi:hypothetical protein
MFYAIEYYSYPFFQFPQRAFKSDTDILRATYARNNPVICVTDLQFRDKEILECDV